MTEPADLRARVRALLDAKEMAANDAAVSLTDAAIAAQVPTLLARIDALTEALERVSAIRPSNWDDPRDPEHLGAWRAVDAALEEKMG